MQHSTELLIIDAEAATIHSVGAATAERPVLSPEHETHSGLCSLERSGLVCARRLTGMCYASLSMLLCASRI